MGKRITFWKEEDKILDKSWRPTEVYIEVNLVNDVYQYRMNVDPGYPDHSGVKTVLFGYAKSEIEAFDKCNLLLKREPIKCILNARELHVLHDKEDTIIDS